MKEIIFLFAFILSANFCFSQSSTYGKTTTPKGNLHAIIVFVQFEDEQLNYVPNWTYGSFPTWAMSEELFNVSLDSIGNKDNLSKWYNDMSLGQFKFTAEVYPSLITVPSGMMIEEDINHSVFSKMDSIQQYSIFDWSKFDKRQNRPNFLFDNTDTINYPRDNKIDFVIALHRKPGTLGGDADGADTYSFTDTIGSYIVADGFEITKMGGGDIGSIKSLFIHEFGHAIYDAPHCGGANSGVTGKRFHTNSMWCMSTTNQSRIFNTVNAWERWHLGWNTITHDLKDTTDNGSYIIQDFITSGDAIRIKIPHTNQFLWIENHQKLNTYDMYGWDNDGYSNPIIYPDKGIYMYIEDLSPTLSKVTYSGHANKLKVLHGNGHYDYTVSANSVPAPEWWGDPAFDFTEVAQNSFGEHHQASFLRFDYNNNGIINYTNNHEGVTLPTNEMYRMYRKNGGVVYGPPGENMAFIVGDKVGLGNNPAIANIQYYNSITKEVDPIHIHNVTVNVESYDTLTGNYQLKILFNDTEINNDIRWTGNLKLTQDTLNPINNPQQITLKSGNTITLDQSLTASRETPVTQPDGSKLFVNPTILSLESGTITTIESGSELLVVKGSTLHIKSGATVIVKGTGKITISPDAYLCVENGANIELQNSASVLHFNTNSIGINPRLAISGNCIDYCAIANLITGSGSITGKTIADAGIDQIGCPNPANNILGGNPSALTGVAPFTYSWTPVTNLSNPTISNPVLTTALTATTSYLLQVTDANGCVGKDTINLTYNPLTTITTSTTNSPCPGTGTATVNVCGNPDAYTYYWNDPQFQTTQTATGLFAGTYTVQVTDANGNVTTVNATVNPLHSTPSYNFVNPVITNDTVWNFGSTLVKVKGEVVVKSGVTLTINSSNVEFSYDLINELGVLYPRARITLQRGGKLIVNNSTLTGCSDGRWDGIEVWGTADTSLRTTAVQGFAKLTNSTVKNALRGVYCNRSIRLNERTAIFQGGRLEVDNCQFINNRNSIILGNYAYNSLNYVKNSTFKYSYNNTFTNYDKIRADGEFFDVVFIQVGNNKISSIADNVFSDINSQENVIGIRSEDANFLPITTNTFNDLSIGVDALGVNSLQGLGITQNIFNRCKKGIYAKGITGLSLNQNNFTIPSSPIDTTYGMYLLDCNMYSIQENSYTGTGGNNAVGLYIYNTDSSNSSQTNQVYRNSFNNLNYASFGNGVNGNAGNPNVGLTFKCNTYSGNDYDVLTTIAPGISIRQGAGGNSSSPAGNKFTDACGAITDGELLNVAVVGTQPNSYQYWYHNTLTYIPDAGCYTPFQVQPNNSNEIFVPSGLGESCPTNFGNCGGACNRDSIRLIQVLNNTLITQLNTTLNGGNSNEVLNTVQQQSKSPGQIKNYLQQHYPLSSEVLIALVNSTYSSGIVKDILLQNSPLSNQVLNALLVRQPQLPSGIVKNILQSSAPLTTEIMNLVLANNYSGGVTNQIINNQQNVPLASSATQIIESNISELIRENNLLTNSLVRSFLHDVDNEYRFDSISVLLKTGGGIIPPSCKACVVEADIKAKNYTEALQEIVVMEQAGEAPEFTSLQRALIDMETMPDQLMSIKTDSALKTTIEAIAVQTNKKGSIHARNLLDMAFKQKVKESYHFPQHHSNNARLINNIESVTDNQQLISQQPTAAYQLTNYPNPFNESTTIQAVLPENKVNTYLVIHDLMGREIYRILLKSGVNKQVIDKNVLQSGIYLYAIEENGVVVNKQKLVKLK